MEERTGLVLIVFIEVIYWSIPAILTIGSYLGFLIYRQLSEPYKVLTWYLFACLLIDAAGRIVGLLFHNNLVLIIIFSLAELIFYYYFISKYLLKSFKINYLVIAASIYMIYEIISLYNLEPQYFQTYSKSVAYFVVLTVLFEYLFGLMKQGKLSPRIIKFGFSFVAFLAMNLLLYLPFNYLINVKTNIQLLFWLFNIGLLIPLYITIINQIWKNGQKLKRSPRG